MSGEINLQKLISTMMPSLSQKEFVFASLPDFDDELLTSLQATATFQEKEGLTVIVEKHIADQNCIKYSGLFKCITLNVHSSLEAVGLTAAVSSQLTLNNISANVVAAFYHDHIFVPSEDAKKALSCLEDLVENNIH